MRKITLILVAIMASVALDAQNTTYCTTDSLFYPYQWGLYNDGQQLPPAVFGPFNSDYNNFIPGIDISACDAWQYTEGEGIKIGIIYTGGFTEITRYPVDIADNIPVIKEIQTGHPDDEAMQQNGIIAAIRNNLEFVGVAPKSKLYPICIRYLNYIPQAIDTALAMGLDIIFLADYDVVSPGVDPLLIEAAIQKAHTEGRNGRGCVVICPSGDALGVPNDG